MQTFTLRLHDHDDVVSDDERDTFPTLLEARAEALRVVSELYTDGAWSREDLGECFVRILDQRGSEVCRVDLWEAIELSSFTYH